MKKIYFVLFACLTGLSINATSFTISIVGTTYSPASSTITVGDVVTIQASATHPLNQVDATVWNANGSTTLTTGWGSQTSNYTFTASAAGTIYFVCQNHVSMGMKGSIVVTAPTGLNETTTLMEHFNLFPNPSIGNVNINFSLKNTSTVSAKLFNVIGQEVSVLLANSELPVNDYNYKFEMPATISAGTYFVVVTINTSRITKKLIVSK